MCTDRAFPNEHLPREDRYSSNQVNCAAKPLKVLAVIPGDLSTFNFARNQVAFLINLGLDIRTFPLMSRTSLSGILKECLALRKELKQFKPDILHAHFGTITAFVCAVSNNVPLVISYKGSDLYLHPDSGPVRARIAFLISQLASLRASRIICVSRRLRDRLWWRRNCTTVIPDGVNMKLFQPRKKEDARAILGWPQNERVVVFNGNKQPRLKGMPLVKDAIKIAEAVVGPIRLVCLDVPFELMPMCLSAADCLLLASMYEGSPNVVKEAMACNLPVVSTDVGDVSERLANVEPSRVVAHDPTAFGQAIAEILCERRRSNGRSQLAECAESRVAESVRHVLEVVADCN